MFFVLRACASLKAGAAEGHQAGDGLQTGLSPVKQFLHDSILWISVEFAKRIGQGGKSRIVKFLLKNGQNLV